MFLSIIMLFRVIVMPFSLIICKEHNKRENSSNWKSGPGKDTLGHLFCNFKQVETSRRFFMDYLRIIGANNYQRGPPGGHNPPGRALVGCTLLGPPPVPIFWYISNFDLEKK